MSGLTKLGFKNTVSKPFTDIDCKALDALIARVTETKENNLALSPEDCQLLLDTLVTLATMQHRLAHHDVTVYKLCKLLGIEKSSEKRAAVCKTANATGHPKKPKVGANEGFSLVKPRVVFHAIQALHKCDACPECHRQSV